MTSLSENLSTKNEYHINNHTHQTGYIILDLICLILQLTENISFHNTNLMYI